MPPIEPSTAVRSLLIHEPAIVVRPSPFVVFACQSDTTAAAYPEGIIVSSPARIGGVAVRQEEEGTSIPLPFI